MNQIRGELAFKWGFHGEFLLDSAKLHRISKDHYVLKVLLQMNLKSNYLAKLHIVSFTMEKVKVLLAAAEEGSVHCTHNQLPLKADLRNCVKVCTK